MLFKKRKEQSLFFNETTIFILLFILIFVFSASCRKAEKSEAAKLQNQSPQENLTSTISTESIELNQEIKQRKASAGAVNIDLTLERLESAYSALEEAARRIPRESFDPQAIIQKCEGDSFKLFEWVRDESCFVPYQGCLRGPVGVLMDRGGNSLDRALLLCELLRSAGYKARLARRHLSEKETQKLIQEVKFTQNNIREPGVNKLASLDEDLVDYYAQNYGLDKQMLLRTISQAKRRQENRDQEIKAQHKQLVGEILPLLSKIRKIDTKENDELINDWKDHWWVQMEKDGQWVDLDPTFFNGKPGEKFGDPQEIVEPDELDEALFHSIKVKLIAEQLKENELTENLVFEYRILPSKILGQQIILRHLPLSWPAEKEFFEAQNYLAFFKEALSKQTEWQAVLEIGEEIVAKAYVSASGNVSDRPSQKSGAKKSRAGGPGALFRGLTGGEEEEKEKEKETLKEGAQLTAEWIEFEIAIPGRPPRIERREIFDLLGPEKRKEKSFKNWNLTEKQRLERALKIVGQREILPLSCRLTSEFIQEVMVKFMLLQRKTYLDLIENFRSWEPEELFKKWAEIKPPSAKLYALALKRFSLSPYSNYMFLTSPNLLARHSFIEENERGELVKKELLDIVANDISSIGKEARNFFSRSIEQGILDTLIEAFEIGPDEAIDNTASLFLRSSAEGIKWTLIPSAEELKKKHLPFSGDILTRLEAELSRGFQVLVPEKEIILSGKPRVAWWRFNPATGNLLGMGERGAGQALAEYAEKAEMILQLKSMIEYYADIGRCLGGVLSAALYQDKPEMRRIVTRCIWMAVCTNAAGVAEGFLDIETNWTNLIIKATLDWAMGSLCEALWDEGIDKRN